jgi:hypothetical protein
MRFHAPILALLAGLCLSGVATAERADWTTPAEASAFAATPSLDDTMAWLRRLEAASPEMHIQAFGRSAQDRELSVVVVSAEGVEAPWQARAAGKPVVLILNGIHSGEIAGKDASLLLLRDLLVDRTMPEILERVILLVVPVYNVDGHENVGHSRINQDGPEAGMGFRTSSLGQDLNRDFVKLDSVEAQALVGSLIEAWEPDLLIDDHTTDGADHQYHLTHGMDGGPWAEPAAAAWTLDCLAHAEAAMDGAGRPVAPYRFPVDRREPEAGLRGGWTAPRFSTSYMALRNRPSILVEAHSLKPFRTRVEAIHAFLGHVLDHVAADPGSLVALRQLLADGLAEGTAVPIRVARTDRSAPFVYETKIHEVVEGEVGGDPYVRYGAEPVQIEVPVFEQLEVTLEVDAPAGYLVPRQYAELARRLQLHGVVVFQLWNDVTLPVEMVRLDEVTFADQPYQGRHRVEVDAWTVERFEDRFFPAGTYWVSLGQPLAKVVVHLLEPCAPDSFFAWGFLSSIMERKEYFERYVMEPLAQQMMRDDPALAAEFEQRLVEDEAFAADSWARLDFFYQRSGHADPDWRLHPIARVPGGLPEGTGLEAVGDEDVR